MRADQEIIKPKNKTQRRVRGKSLFTRSPITPKIGRACVRRIDTCVHAGIAGLACEMLPRLIA